jgi:hypothetical protein
LPVSEGKPGYLSPGLKYWDILYRYSYNGIPVVTKQTSPICKYKYLLNNRHFHGLPTSETNIRQNNTL